MSWLGSLAGATLWACRNAVTTSTSGTGGTDVGTTTSAGTSATTASATSSSTTTGGLTCTSTLEETSGPYPDKTDMLDDPAFYRTDVTEGKTGAPLSLKLQVVDSKSACAPIANATVEIWHCDKDGVYSEYGGQPGEPDQTGTTFLRGLQTADASGNVSFTTIYPGWYMGRATHIHVDVYVDKTLVKTTQMAFPETVNADVYASTLYSAKGPNPVSNANEMVFAGDVNALLWAVTGDLSSGLAASFTIVL